MNRHTASLLRLLLPLALCFIAADLLAQAPARRKPAPAPTVNAKDVVLPAQPAPAVAPVSPEAAPQRAPMAARVNATDEAAPATEEQVAPMQAAPAAPRKGSKPAPKPVP